MSDLTTVVLAVLSSAVTTGGLALLLRDAYTSWLQKRIQFGFDRDLEAIRASISESSATMNLAHNVLSESVGAVRERRLNSYDALWRALLDMRNVAPEFTTFNNVLTREEMRNPSHLEKAAQKIPFPTLFERAEFSPELEVHRPYVGELAWAYFFTARQIIGRIMYLHTRDGKDGSRSSWLDDAGLRGVLQASLTPSELEQLDSLTLGHLSLVQSFFDNKFLTEMRVVFSGEGDSARSIELARKIQKATLKTSSIVN